LDLCDDEKKAQIEEYMKLSAEIETKISPRRKARVGRD
jgi:hypothetical protein